MPSLEFLQNSSGEDRAFPGSQARPLQAAPLPGNPQTRPPQAAAPLLGSSLLDPRTKLLLALTVGLVMTSGGYGGAMVVIRPLLAALPFVLLLLSRRTRPALLYGSLYALAWAAETFLLTTTFGIVNFIILAACGMMSRFLPGVMTCYYLMTSTTVSQFMAAMCRMHVSNKIAIPLSVMFRFFPTVAEEYAAISDAMRMRGVSLAGGRPQAMLEYRLIPMMTCSLRIGEELSVAALTRGLGAPIRRTNVCAIGLRILDWIIIAACVCVLALHTAILLGYGVFL
jgi:energy-coupling factor transport system permease protein